MPTHAQLEPSRWEFLLTDEAMHEEVTEPPSTDLPTRSPTHSLTHHRQNLHLGFVLTNHHRRQLTASLPTHRPHATVAQIQKRRGALVTALKSIRNVAALADLINIGQARPSFVDSPGGKYARRHNLLQALRAAR